MTTADLKHHPLTVSAYKTFLRATSSHVQSWVFTATTGRSGTDSLRAILGAVDRGVTFHEPFPVMHDRCPEGVPRGPWFRSRFETLKSVYVRRAGRHCRHYFETNHQFIKHFADLAYEEFGRKLKVIHLQRDPVSVAQSFYRLDSIPGRSDRGLLWLLDPADLDNAIRVDDLLAPGGELEHDFYRCLWYWHEIEARVQRFRRRYAMVPVAELHTDDLNDLEALEGMFRTLDIPVDHDRLRTLVGTRTNTKPREHHGSLPREEAEAMEARMREVIEGRYPGMLVRGAKLQFH